MNKEIPKETEDFLNKTREHQKKQVEGVAYLVLAESLKEGLCVFDLPYYVLQRSRKLIEDCFKTVSFKNKKLIKARKAYLKECLAVMRDNLPSVEKDEGVDETAVRNNRCEPVCRKLVEMLLDDNIVFSDEDYFDRILENEESIPLSSAVGGYINALDEELITIISKHYGRANKKLWGVEKEDITFEMLDSLLKKD